MVKTHTIIPRIVITPGEPAGIGPELMVRLAQQPCPAQLIAIADTDLLQHAAEAVNLPLTIHHWQPQSTIIPHQAQQLWVLPKKTSHPVIAGKADPANAKYVLDCIKTAADLCLQHQVDAMVTGPVAKHIINQAGFHFSGHTEYLAELTNTRDVVMFFHTQQLNLALVTTHIPLAQVARSLNQQKVETTIRIVAAELKQRFRISHPKLLVCGLNPHAGEHGHLGTEGQQIIAPAIAAMQQQGIDVKGPYPADTIFTPHYRQQADVILAMYHDQGLPVIKYIGFGEAVNVTLGLPIIRTSVDHGVAFDIAGQNKANADSLHHAVNLAIQLAQQSSQHKDSVT